MSYVECQQPENPVNEFLTSKSSLSVLEIDTTRLVLPNQEWGVK
jgi:hypothetical protein